MIAEEFSWNIVNKFKEQNVCGANLDTMSDSLLARLGMDAMHIKHFRSAVKEQ